MELHESNDKKDLIVTFDLPGFKKEEITIDMHGDRLIVSGHFNKAASAPDQDGFSIRKKAYGKFTRSLLLPSGTKVCK